MSRHVQVVLICDLSVIRHLNNMQACDWPVALNPVLRLVDTDIFLSVLLRRTGTQDCCHVDATCTCGAHDGYYSCICPAGYYGRGLRGDCHSK